MLFKSNMFPGRKRSFLFLLAMLFCMCACYRSNAQVAAQQSSLSTNSIFTDPSKVNWDDVQAMTAKDGNLTVIQKNKERMLVSRAAYTKYVQKHYKASGAPLFENVEVEPAYPGGQKAWMQYLIRNLRYPQEALNKQVSGSVVVQFIVDEKGKVKEIEPLTTLGSGLEAEVIRLVKESGKWHPAIQNLHLVRAYKQLSIQFQQK